MEEDSRLPPGRKVLCLFDVDGTLTAARERRDPGLARAPVPPGQQDRTGQDGTGRDPSKIARQSPDPGDLAVKIIHKFDYVFAENGTVQYKDGKLISKQAIQNQLGEELLQDLINFCLRYMGLLKLPKKRWQPAVVPVQTACINSCDPLPVCAVSSQDENSREVRREKIREKFVATLQKEFAGKGLRFTRENLLKINDYTRSLDKPEKINSSTTKGLSDWRGLYYYRKERDIGGNDYEIFNDPRTIGFTVYSPTDTARLCRELFFSTPPAAP
uniref:Phosphomannomutase n=1 Tax=Lepisosteus oculatus TaxID=7918 RepID=W5N0Z1_LEPOC